MARQFNQEWAEPLTQQEAVLVTIGLQITDNLSLPWQDGVSFIMPATTVASAGQVSQAQFSEDLPMAPQGDGDFVSVSLGLILSDVVSLKDTFFYAHVQRTAGGNTGSRVDIGDNGSPIILLEAFSKVFGLVLTLTDNLNLWLDPQFGTVDNSLLDLRYLVVAVDTSSNLFDDVQFVNGSKNILVSDQLAWGDAEPGNNIPNETLDFVLTPTLISISDKNWRLNWVDSSIVGLGLALIETLTMSDGLSIGYGDQVVDALFMQDVNGYGYEPYGFSPYGGSTQLGFIIGYGDLTTDQMTLSDALIELPQGGTFSYELTDATGLIEVGAGTVGLDSLPLADALIVGYEQKQVDSLTLSDSVVVGYRDVVSDTLVFLDSMIVGYGDSVVDALLLSDVNQVQLSVAVTLSDSLTLSDFLASGFGNFNLITDSLTLSDQIIIGYGDRIVDTLSLSDSDLIGYSNLITDSLTLSDSNLIGYGDRIADSLTLVDAFSLNLVGSSLTVNLSDQMLMSDLPSGGVGYGVGAYGQIPYGGGFQGLLLGYGDLIKDQIVLQDKSPTIIGEYDISIIDFGLSSLWNDGLVSSFSVGYGVGAYGQIPYGGGFLTKIFSDQMLMSDLPSGGYGTGPYGQIPYGGGAQAGLLLGYGDLIKDQLSITDRFVFGLGLSITDALTMSDQLDTIGIVVRIVERLVYENQLAQDIFNRPPESPLDPVNWATVTGFNPLRVLSNRCLATDPISVGSTQNYIGVVLPKDQYAEIVLNRSAVGDQFDILLRADSTHANYYDFGFIDNGDGTADVYIKVGVGGGGPTTLYENTRLPFAFVSPSDIFSAMVVGNKLTFYRNGVLFGQATDNQISSAGVASLYLHINPLGSVADLQIASFACGQAIGISEQVGVGYGLQTSDSLLMLDSSNIFGGFINSLDLSDTLTLSDQFSLLFEFDEILSDQLVLVDQFSSVINVLSLSDSLFLTDLVALAINGIRLSDALTLTDQLGFSIGGAAMAQYLPDIMSLTDWVDIIVYVTMFGDTLTMSDKMVLGYGARVAEQLTQTDSLVKSLLPFSALIKSLSDTMTLADVMVSSIVGTNIDKPVSDSFIVVDQVAIEYGNSLSDLLSLLDGLVFGISYEEMLVDSLTLADVLVVGYGDLITDQITLSDAVVTSALIVAETLTDVLLLSDVFGLGYGSQIIDQLTQVDSVVLLYPLALVSTDQLVLSDQVRVGFGSSVIDQLVFSDVARIGYGDIISEQLILLDEISIEQLGALTSIFPSDTLTMSDALIRIGYGLLPVDQLSITEQIGVGYGFRVVDQITLLDQLSFSYVLFEILSDTTTVLDQLRIEFGFSLSDTLSLAESLSIGIGYLIVEQLTIAERAVFGVGLIISDQMVLAERVTVGSGITVSDQLTAQTDDAAFIESMLVQISEATPGQLDVLAQLLAAALAIEDIVVFQEQLVLMHGIIVGDVSIALADQLDATLIVPLYEALVDSELANWLDPILTLLVFAPTTIVLSSLTVLPELVAGLQVISEVEAESFSVTKAEV